MAKKHHGIGLVLKYLVALREAPLAFLWSSQVLSAVGDQLYMLAAMWIAVDRFGSRAAYVAAAIGIAKIAFGLAGGLVADRFNRRWVMIISDVIRFLALAPLPFIAAYGTLDFWHLVVSAALIGGFGSFFDPALQACLPSITRSRTALEAMTGLIDLTQRFARAVGPGLVGLLVAFIPIWQFFTIDAVSFLISAGTVFFLGSHLNFSHERSDMAPFTGPGDLLRDISEGFAYVAGSKALFYCYFNLGLLCGLWGIAFTVGVPILVKQSFADNVSNYGYLVAAYGVGSVLGNVVFANLQVRSSWFKMFIGDALCGLGFVILAWSRSMPIGAAGMVLGAAGAAVSDLVLLNLFMAEVPARLLGKTFSLRMTVVSGGHALGLLVAGPLFAMVAPTPIIGWSGVLMFLFSMYGAIRFKRTELTAQTISESPEPTLEESAR